MCQEDTTALLATPALWWRLIGSKARSGSVTALATCDYVREFWCSQEQAVHVLMQSAYELTYEVKNAPKYDPAKV